MHSSRHAFVALMVGLQAPAKVARPPEPLKPRFAPRPSASSLPSKPAAPAADSLRSRHASGEAVRSNQIRTTQLPDRASDGLGGTLIIDPPASAAPAKTANVALFGSYIASAFAAGGHGDTLFSEGFAGPAQPLLSLPHS